MAGRVPDTPEVTRMPLTVSLPLVAAAAGKAVAAEMASAIPEASSAPVIRDFMAPPRFAGHSAVLGWQGGGEKVDGQLRDALGVVVRAPGGRVGPAPAPV